MAAGGGLWLLLKALVYAAKKGFGGFCGSYRAMTQRQVAAILKFERLSEIATQTIKPNHISQRYSDEPVQ